MLNARQLSRRFRQRFRDPRRRGVIIILAAFLVQAMFAFAAFAVDLGFIVLTSQQLQNAADAAALAAVLELKTANSDDTVEVLKQRALDEATYAGSLNRAALRPVVIGPTDVTFGNRTFNHDTNKFETEYGDDLTHVNSVEVVIKYDGDSAPAGVNNWTPRTGRERLDLFFGRVIHVNDTVVSGASKANLAPRDLVFCIDVSGSMFGGSGGNTNNSGTTMLPLLLGNIYTASSVSGRYPQWYDKATYYNNYQKQWEDSMSNETWGTTTQRNAFVAQEFPDRDSAEPWKHWKWKAFCDWNFASSGGGFNTVGSARVYNGNGETQNFNVPMTKAGRLVTRSTAAGASGSEKGQKFNPSGAANSNVGAMMGPEDYTCFCVWNGYIPCVRGQKYYPRDGDGVAGLDNPSNVIAQDANTPYPTSIVYYPKVRDVENFNKALMGSGASFTGIYPGNVDAKSMSTVRQAALFGLNAMIESEIQGNAEIVFNQVGMVTFGTFAHPDLDLTNQLDYALRAGVSRITTNPGNPYITPHACGATNIGMGIRYSVRMLTDPYGKGRSFANKSIALLTDGEPNYSPSPAGNYEGNEFNGNTQTLNGPNDTASARAYGEYWADKCKSLDIQLHCIGLGLGASGQTYLEGLAQRGGGIFEHITDAQAQKQDLINLFVLIAKDKLGKLYLQ